MSEDRREFLQKAGLLAAGISLVDLARNGAAHAQEPENPKDNKDQPSQKEIDAAAKGEWTADLGKVKDLNEKEPVLVKAVFLDSLGNQQEDEKIFVRWEKVNADTGRWIIKGATCTHLKCTIEFTSGMDRFVCPCHGSEYGLDGEVLKRPSRKPLKDYSDKAFEEDGKLKLKRNS
ncbi:MAG: Rieske 2Fe-2S domain-containing protein [Planctomycetales bacterium]|nr:Rieske 2Fe-2S domain-containing protein [bacterium]UNM07763.1 MAG: Rieske 2Fe-2S domain-containing protein [Planctomycetales bacterium]